MNAQGGRLNESEGVQHLHALARSPRFTGTPSADAARQYCVAALERSGFAVETRPFDYSQVPGLWATPLAGLWSAAVLSVWTILGMTASAASALAVALTGLIALALGAGWLARRGILTLPLARARGTNLVATRGSARPAVWLVAHVDSKSQLVPMLVRVASIVVLALAWGTAIVLSFVVWLGVMAPHEPAWRAIGIAGALAALGVAATLVGARSPGAVDNASGVATVLAATEQLPNNADVGVLITDAEELGLAGARALALELPQAIVLNVDGVDDDGVLTAMGGSPGARLATALATAARAEGVALRVRRLIPGILVDAVAFADAGWAAVTLSRGTARTLMRIHMASDGLEQMTGRGIPTASRVLARAATEIASWK